MNSPLVIKSSCFQQLSILQNTKSQRHDLSSEIEHRSVLARLHPLILRDASKIAILPELKQYAALKRPFLATFNSPLHLQTHQPTSAPSHSHNHPLYLSNQYHMNAIAKWHIVTSTHYIQNPSRQIAVTLQQKCRMIN